MLPLRYRWLWLSLGWILVVAVCFGSLMPGKAVPEIGLSDKLLHAGSYFLLMVWFAGLYPRGRHLAIALVLFALGAMLDLAQSNVSSRSFDVRDIVANASGILIALMLSFWLIEGWCQRMEEWLSAARSR